MTPQVPLATPEKKLQQFLQGKLLLRDEIPFSKKVLQQQAEHGFLEYVNGIDTTRGQPVCVRCGNNEHRIFASFMCACCGSWCRYCRKCLMLGRVSECTKLIRWKGALSTSEPIPSALRWQGELSPGQRKASKKLVETVQAGGEQLVWAVCGAGKTEILFESISHALALGKRVCIATPRTDVVLELTPRLKQAFPTVPIRSLYGGSKDNKKPLSLLAITTTHQLMRYDCAFDVMILDEVDAFPYSVDKCLQYVAKRATAPNAATIYLTATPSLQFKKRVVNGTLSAVQIPKRFHGNPLPVPTFRWCGNWKKLLRKGILPAAVQQWLQAKQNEAKQVFLFVPSIDVLEQVTPLVQQISPQCESIHAEDSERVAKMKAFRKGELRMLVTTTILERGVTIPSLDVAVLGSESQIFTESALVQIAGRVGRSKDDPTGDVVFYHFGKTKAMLEARRHIQYMNKEGESS